MFSFILSLLHSFALFCRIDSLLHLPFLRPALLVCPTHPSSSFFIFFFAPHGIVSVEYFLSVSLFGIQKKNPFFLFSRDRNPRKRNRLALLLLLFPLLPLLLVSFVHSPPPHSLSPSHSKHIQHIAHSHCTKWTLTMHGKIFSRPLPRCCPRP